MIYKSFRNECIATMEKSLFGRGPPLKSIMSDFTILYCTYNLHDPVIICVTISFFLFLFLSLHWIPVRIALIKKDCGTSISDYISSKRKKSDGACVNR